MPGFSTPTPPRAPAGRPCENGVSSAAAARHLFPPLFPPSSLPPLPFVWDFPGNRNGRAVFASPPPPPPPPPPRETKSRARAGAPRERGQPGGRTPAPENIKITHNHVTITK